MATLIIGLGNPGGEYAGTRHNCGWMVLDELERRGRFGRARREGPAKLRSGSVDGFDLVLACPTTYMNLSGRAGVHLVRALGVPVSDVVVVHDDVDVAFGRLRLRRGGSAGGHRGVVSLIESWQTPDFIRVRVGVGRPPAGGARGAAGDPPPRCGCRHGDRARRSGAGHERVQPSAPARAGRGGPGPMSNHSHLIPPAGSSPRCLLRVLGRAPSRCTPSHARRRLGLTSPGRRSGSRRPWVQVGSGAR
jgi:PTH1 family peptidyl-tRNA hydrolase